MLLPISIRQNSKGPDVRTIQELLNRHGANLIVDGDFGPKTNAAVRAFQVSHGLVVDGIVGPQTLAALQGNSGTTPPSIPSRRWHEALLKAPTTGASVKTASQDHLPAGIKSSQQMAKTDLPRVLKLSARFRQIGTKDHIPPALIAALASRESRGGAALNAQGFGDGGNAFGILQVDRRYHKLAGLGAPASLAHIEQAIGIL